MKNSVLITILFSFLVITQSSCELVTGIFKAGFWSAFIVIGLVIALIIFIISKMRRRDQ